MEVTYEVYDGVIVVIEQEPVSKEIIEVPAFDDSPHVIEILAGEPGVPNSLSIGEVVASAPGAPAGATIEGSAPNQSLSLVIPRGEIGPIGPVGPANVLTAGQTTTASPSSEAAVQITGEAPDQTVNFTIPRGARWHRLTTVPAPSLGLQGDWAYHEGTHEVYEKTSENAWTSRGNIKGATGDTGPVNVLDIGNVTTSAPGSPAAVEVIGDAPTQTLNFTLPRGETGPANTLSVGSVETTAPGELAEADIEGDAPAQTLNLRLPRGETGPPNVLSVGAVSASEPGSIPVISITGTAPTQTLNMTLPRGQVGPANSLSVGEVQTGTPGSTAAASISGTAPSQTLSLTIPRGDVGPIGPANVLSIGSVETSAPGTQASVEIDGESPTQTLHITIPRGDTGAQGPVNTLVVGDVVTGAPGTDVVASITGNSPNQVLNLTIPQGLPGQGNVDSVNGKPGPDIVLTAADVGAATTAEVNDMFDGASAYFRNRENHTGTQAISTVSGLQSALDSKSGTGHTHTVSSITDFDAAVDSRVSLIVAGAPNTLDTLNELAAAIGNDPNFATTMTNQIATKAPLDHGHALTDANITGILPIAQVPSLDADKITTGIFALARLPVATSGTSSATQLVRADDVRLSNARTPVAHTHTIADLPVATSGTSNATQLVRADDVRLSDARTPTAHSHTITDVADLQNALELKAASNHGHSLTDANITGVLPLAQMPSHTHTIANVTGLQTALDAKAASTHTHTIANVAGLQAALDAKQASGSYALTTHGHALTDANITGVLPLAQMPEHHHTDYIALAYDGLSNPIDMPGGYTVYQVSSGSSTGTQVTYNLPSPATPGTRMVVRRKADDNHLRQVWVSVWSLSPSEHIEFVSDGSSWGLVTPSPHSHSAASITSGTIAQARMVQNTQRFIFTAANATRPSGSTYVEWVGPVEPTNAIDGDSWVNTA